MDNKIYALVQGEKGLYYTDGVRIYFPDRKWTEAKLGFFTDLHITIEKDKYSFISGKMIETLPLSSETFFENKPFKLSSQYFYKLLGDTMVIIEKDCNGNWSAYVNTRNGIQEVFYTEDYVLGYMHMYKEHYRRNCFTDVLFKDRQSIDITSQIRSWYANNCKLTEDKFMEACIRLISRPEFWYRDIINFRLYDDSFIVVNYIVNHSMLRDKEKSQLVFVYSNSCGLDEVNNVDVEALGKVTKILTKDEVDDFCVKNHICVGYGHDTDFNSNVVEHTFSGFNTEVTVYAWEGSKFTTSMLNDKDTIDTIEASFSRLQAMVKRIGKCCSGKMIQELQKFNPRPWLLRK